MTETAQETNVLPEEQNGDAYPEEKSWVKPKAKKPTFRREYKDGERVSTLVLQGTIMTSKTFLIYAHRINGDKHEYQLEEELTGAIFGQGRWFQETELDHA